MRFCLLQILLVSKILSSILINIIVVVPWFLQRFDYNHCMYRGYLLYTVIARGHIIRSSVFVTLF